VKTVKIIFVIIIFIALTVITATCFLLFSSFGQQKIISIVNTKIDGEIAVEKLSLNFFEFSVKIKNASFSMPENGMFASLESLRAAVDFNALVRNRKIIVKYLEIDNPALNLELHDNEEEKNDDFDLEDFLNTGVFDLLAKRVEIKNAQITLKKEEELSLFASELNLLAQNIDLRELSLDLQVNSNKILLKTDTLNVALDALSLKISGSPKSINLKEIFVVSSVKDTIQLSGSVENPIKLENFKLDLALNSSLKSLSEYNLQLLPKENTLNLRAKVNLSGSLAKPTANVVIDVDNIRIFDVSAKDLRAQIILDREILRIDSLNVRDISAQNFVGDIFLKTLINVPQIDDFNDFSIDKLSGVIETKVKVKETTTNELLNLAAKAQLKNSVVNLDFLKVNARNLDLLEVRGKYNIEKEIVAANVRVFPQNINDFSDFFETPLESAIISADIAVAGSINSPKLDFSAVAEKIKFEDFFVDRIEVAGNYSGTLGAGSGNISVKSDALENPFQSISQFLAEISIKDSLINLENLSFFITPDDIVQISGSYNLNGEYSVFLRIPNLNLEEIAAISELEVSGVGKIEISAAGNINEEIPLPKTANIALEFNALNYQNFSEFGFGNSQNIYAEIKNNKIFLAANGIITMKNDSLNKITFNENGEIKLYDFPVILIEEWKINLSGGGNFLTNEFSLSAKTEIPLKRFSPMVEEFLDSLDGTANINANVEISADREIPKIEAFVFLQNISGNIAYLEQKLHSFSGKITYKDDIAKIEDLSGMIDNGRFSIAGIVNLEDMQNPRGNIDVIIERILANYQDMGSITVDGKISAALSQNSASVSGNIDILDAIFFQDVNTNIFNVSGIANQRTAFGNVREEASLRARQQSNFPIDLNLTIRQRGDIIVDNNLAYMSLVPDILIGGTAQFPSVSGRLTVEDGEIHFNRNTFQISQGIIDFTDPFSVRPELDIVAETEIDDYEITMRISGDPQSELFFEFSSQPALDDNDILSLILFGRIGFEMRDEIANVLLDNLMGRTDSRDLRISYRDGDISMAMTRNLSRRLSLEYSAQTVGGEAVQTGTATFRLSDFLRLKAYSSTNDQAGVQLEAAFERRR